MSRPRKPPALHAIQGTFRNHRHGKQTPMPSRACPPPPSRLTNAERVAWRQIAREADRLGVLTACDVVALEAAAGALADLREARRTLAERGGSFTYAIPTRRGAVWRRQPEAAVIADADRRLMGWLSRFGLTPADRARVAALPSKPCNNFDDF
ncbi:MAG TPA: P27 family phage terminase small subunit [Rhizomicrobium sp.]|jgi:P27 family predicted phage terminase small subunit|nr:P27 family phage terminase small subunit [Rhizomicrobium sp.]